MKRIISLFLTLALTLFAKEIIIKGSDTMVNLVQQLAEGYMGVKPDVTISVVGGGSGVGITSLIEKEVDIANASRNIKDKEIVTAKGKGVNPFEIPIGVDLLCIIVNEKNPITKLTISQLGKIYQGQIKNWKEVGGINKPISLYGRQPASGTFVLFREMVVKGEYSQAMKQMAGNAQIVDAVSSDISGIGYVGLGYVKEAKGIKVLAIAQTEKGPYFSPLVPEELGKYPIARYLYQYTNGKPKGDAKRFIEWELSDAGQKIVEEVGFLPLPEAVRKEVLNKIK
ncbi:MAG: PstS family phosphate ABC transporter substrate-binding protein [candidate division WOR-3 bacterium]